MESQITSESTFCSNVCSDIYQRKHQSSVLLAPLCLESTHHQWIPFVKGIHRWWVDSPHKGPVTWKKIPFHDIIMVIWDVQGIRLQCLSVGSHKPVCQVHLAGVLCLCWALAGCRLLHSPNLTAVTMSVGFETCACMIGLFRQRLEDACRSSAFWVSCKWMWAHVIDENFHCLSETTDSSLHSPIADSLRAVHGDWERV